MKKYLIVTGGQLFNKGAQAMTFITADEAAKRYPEMEVVVLSNMDSRRSNEDKQRYTFRIAKYPKPLSLLLMQTRLGRLLHRLFGGKTAKEFEEIVRNGVGIVDVSGYSLGSNWGYQKSIFYLTRLGIAHSVGIPIYLMPQSFGPFDYKGLPAPWIQRLLRRKLRYAEIIMCREKEGYELLRSKYGLDNLILAPDLVLQNTGIDMRNIYREVPVQKEVVVPDNSVALIPNKKTMLYGNPEQLFEMYRCMIEVLLERGKQVFLVYHSAEDLPICRDIKENYFRESKLVTLVEQELSCLEFDELVKRFDFVVASRFHAVEHAYRNAVPAIVPGWAVKYQELLERFSQEAFMFDVRGQIKTDDIVNAVQVMCDNHNQFSEQIENELQEIRKNNVYDYIKL